MSAYETVTFLNDLLIAFDEAAERYGVEKVKTIGSGYMAVSGLSIPRIDHTKRVVDFALEMVRILHRFNRERNSNLIAIVALGEILIWLRKRNPSLAVTLQIIRNLVLPSLALFILLNKILGLSGDRPLLQIVQTLVGVCAIHAVLSLANGLLFGDVKVGTWQANIPKLFRDLVRFFLIAVGTALVLSVVSKADLGGLVAALGVGSIVIGLALQDTLGNLFSGITLLFERPFNLGDWLEVNGLKGKVIEINWRAVHLLTRELELLVIPNGVLAKEVIRNYRLPQKLHVEPVDIGFSYNDPPNKVKRVLKETALATTGVLNKPEPVIQTIEYGDSSINYRVRLFLADYDKVPQIREEIGAAIETRRKAIRLAQKSSSNGKV